MVFIVVSYDTVKLFIIVLCSCFRVLILVSKFEFVVS